MSAYTSMTVKQLLKYTDGRKERCPRCRCFSVRVPKDGSDPFCTYDRCSKPWVQDPELRTDRPKLTLVESPEDD